MNNIYKQTLIEYKKEIYKITNVYQNNFLKIDKNGIDFDNIMMRNSILDFDIHNDKFIIYIYNNKKEFPLNEYNLKNIKNYIIDYLDNFYEKYTIDDFEGLLDIPVINEEKYIDYISENIKNFNITINIFMILIYNNNAYKNLKSNFNTQLDYLINASKFDLI